MKIGQQDLQDYRIIAVSQHPDHEVLLLTHRQAVGQVLHIQHLAGEPVQEATAASPQVAAQGLHQVTLQDHPAAVAGRIVQDQVHQALHHHLQAGVAGNN